MNKIHRRGAPPTQPSPLRLHVRKKGGSTAWGSNQKITLLAIGALAAIGVGYLIYSRMSSEVGASAFPKAIIERQDQPITRFADHFYRMPSNGYMSSMQGRNLCMIEQSYPKPEACDALSSTLEGVVQERYPEFYQEQMAQSTTRLDTGYLVGLPQDVGLGMTKATIGENPRRVLNFKRALEYIEETVLKNPREFFSQSPAHLKRVVEESHRKLLNGFSTVEGPLAGAYRDFCGAVTKAIHDQSSQGLLELARENGGEVAAPELYQKIAIKMGAAHTMNGFVRSLEEKEREFFQKYIGYLTPKPEQISGLMDAFSVKLKEYGLGILDRKVDAIEAAADIHCEMGDIHPFKDGNGKLARLWMNILLQLGGHKSAIFPKDDAYTNAIVQQQQGVVGAFQKFLKEIILWNRRQGY